MGHSRLPAAPAPASPPTRQLQAIGGVLAAVLLGIGIAFVIAVGATLPAAAQVPPGSTVLVLGPGDQIDVNIVNYPDLKTTTRVSPQGRVILPLVGDVQIDGLTTEAASHAIEARYRAGGFIKTPTVRIEILDYQSRKASVLGQVNAQGLIVLDRAYSVAEILAKAGGLAPGAADTAVIIRQRPGGGSERLIIDIGQLLSASGNGALTEVRAGDVVFVPKAPTISVIGAVVRAGTYPMTTGMTVEQAIAAAGDVNAVGSRSKLKVRRPGPEGGATTPVPIRIDDRVQPGDIIIVGERLL